MPRWAHDLTRAWPASARSGGFRLGIAADRVPSGACRADVDLPADAVLISDRAEDVTPELLGQRNPYHAAVGEAIENGPQPRLVGADDRQFHPGLYIQGGVVAVAGPQGYVAAGEQRVDDLVLFRLAGGWVHIATPGDSGLAAEYLLVKGDGLFCVTGEEQIGVERDGHDVGPFGQGPAVSRGCHTGVHVLSDQVHRTCCSGRQSAYCIRGAALRPGRDGPHTPT